MSLVVFVIEAYFPVHLVVKMVAIGGPLALMLLGAMAIADAPPAALLGVEACWLNRRLYCLDVCHIDHEKLILKEQL